MFQMVRLSGNFTGKACIKDLMGSTWCMSAHSRQTCPAKVASKNPLPITAYCIATAYCLLLIAYCLLPIAY